MRIVQTPTRFYPYTGGVENYVYNLSKELVKLGYDISVICANEPDIKTERVNGVRVKRLYYPFKIANTNITPKLPHEVWKEEFDIIHTHLPTPWSADWSAIMSKIKHKPLVLTYHNDIVGFGAVNLVANLYRKTMLKLVLRAADAIIITNKKQMRYSHSLKKYVKKIFIVPPGVDTKKFRPLRIEKDENSIFFLGVLDKYHKYKGLDYLLTAITLVKKEIKNVKLTVGGAGELLGYYREMVNSLDLGKNVEFVGYVPENRLAEYYNKNELFVLPSTSSQQEGFGMVLLEAMACGLPVVTTNLVGLGNEIERENAGIVTMPKNAELLSNAVIACLKNKKYRKNTRKLAEKYDWSKIAKKISEVYVLFR
jgi:glycosyltransferase involved in cell wall biosynthesis